MMKKLRGLQNLLADYPEWETLIQKKGDNHLNGNSTLDHSPTREAVAQSYVKKAAKVVDGYPHRNVLLPLNDQGISSKTKNPAVKAFGTDFIVEPFGSLQPIDKKFLNRPNRQQHSSLDEKNEPLKNTPVPANPKLKTNGVFDFDQADEVIEGKRESYAQQTQKEVDDFEKKLQHLLTGHVPKEYADKVETEQMSNQSQNPTPSSATPLPEVKEDEPHPHAFFEQITKARTQSSMLDLGSFTAQMEQMEAFDKMIDQRKKKSHQQSVNPSPPKPEVNIPETVEMTNMELIEDLHDMGVKKPAKTSKSETFSQAEVIRESFSTEAFSSENIKVEAPLQGATVLQQLPKWIPILRQRRAFLTDLIQQKSGKVFEHDFRFLLPLAHRLIEQGGFDHVDTRLNNPYHLKKVNDQDAAYLDNVRQEGLSELPFGQFPSEEAGVKAYFQLLDMNAPKSWQKAYQAILEGRSFQDFIRGLQPDGNQSVGHNYYPEFTYYVPGKEKDNTADPSETLLGSMKLRLTELIKVFIALTDFEIRASTTEADSARRAFQKEEYNYLSQLLEQLENDTNWWHEDHPGINIQPILNTIT